MPPPRVRDPRTVELQAGRDRLRRQIASREAEESRLRAQVADYGHRIEVTPGLETELTGIMRDYDTLKGIYAKLLGRKEEAQISANLQENDIGEQFMIVAPATLPSRPASPNRLQLNLAGVFGGLVFALGLAGFLEYRDSSLRTDHDVLAALALPTLVTIPVILPPWQVRRQRTVGAIFWLSALAALAAGAALLLQSLR